MPSLLADRFEARRKFLLGLLEHKSEGLRRKEIKKQWVIKGFPESNFSSVFARLKQRGYIAKQNPELYLSPYVITEAGKRYLSGLRA